MHELLVFLAYVATSAVCVSVTVCALAYPFIRLIGSAEAADFTLQK